jgi:hypothetical protein
MARTTLVKTAAKGPFPALPISADSLDLTLAAADVANKNQFLPSGNDLLVMQNSGASAYTVTITSAADAQNRTGDVATYSLAAGDIAVFLIKSIGWTQTDGYVYLEASNAAVKFGVVAL